jgi:hypothetical protein
LVIIFSLFFVYTVIMFFFLLYANPHGRWDAWYIWNLRARFLYRGNKNWIDAFSALLSHGDYPLLLPLNIARYWFQIKRETILIPGLLSLLFVLSSLGILVSTFFLIGKRIQGYLAGIFLMGTPFFIFLSADQIADNPLAYYFLAALVLFFLYDQRPGTGSGLLILAGTMTGLSGWTKNEGLLFMLAVPLTRLFVPKQGWKTYSKTMALFLLGSAPVLIAILTFKIFIAPPNDLWGTQTFNTLLQKMTDGSRYVQVGKSFLLAFYNFGYWPLIKLNVLLICYGIIFGLSWPRLWGDLLSFTAVIFIMVFGYFFIFILSPHDLSWHLRTAAERLFLQLWPSLLFAYFLLLHPPTPIGTPSTIKTI